jgi:hypothetical protein
MAVSVGEAGLEVGINLSAGTTTLRPVDAHRTDLSNKRRNNFSSGS